MSCHFGEKNVIKQIVLLAVALSIAPVMAASPDAPAVKPRPHVLHSQGGAASEVPFELRDGARATETNGAVWALSVESTAVSGQADAHDYRLTWTLTTGTVASAAVAVDFDFDDWSPTNFVFVPAAVYDGNRFDIKHVGYPPYWYSTNEWRLDMPTTMTPNPTLGRGPGAGRIELDTGYVSVPMLAFHAPVQQRGWMVQTTQGSRLGNHRLLIEERAGRTSARVAISTPVANWKSGDTIAIQFRVYSFQAAERADLLQRFLTARKDLNPAARNETLPFSAAWKLMDALYRDHRWDERIGMYWLTDPAAGNKGWNFIWQLGWCGGGQVTLPLLMRGDEATRKRALRNLDVIFTKSQAPSGFFNAIGNGEQFASFGFGQNFKYHESLVRSQGDWLYMAQRQFGRIEADGGTVPAHWKTGLQKLADAFARLWAKRGQFGQFVNVETGDLCIGGSTCGGIVPGALALASRTFHEQRYLDAAKAAARQYRRDFVLKGYTTGGPGEILSAPDSESAFGLFESFMALYEVTGEREWLDCARELLPVCASWIVAYDFQFPPNSAMGRIDARSCGAMWASVANKHGAPGICTWSGDSLLKYFRATGDRRGLDLLVDIAHGITQYISRDDRRVGNLPAGGICERVNLSSWEGPHNIGGNIFASCAWCETAAMLTITQIPGLYVQPDTGVFAVFDHIKAERVGDGRTLTLKLTNPTQFPADVSVLVEKAKRARKPVDDLMKRGLRVIHLDAGASTQVDFN